MMMMNAADDDDYMTSSSSSYLPRNTRQLLAGDTLRLRCRYEKEQDAEWRVESSAERNRRGGGHVNATKRYDHVSDSFELELVMERVEAGDTGVYRCRKWHRALPPHHFTNNRLAKQDKFAVYVFGQSPVRVPVLSLSFSRLNILI